ncbi:hypothetical protein QVD17_18581 [Tagetes erecta]|uniref:Uncharacterized protein n=1 Tax=Tagetes erecta TaxID=13708 RepID=A0AAD8KI75_TARER|nr:hypothetical protein QVD17_18581 [Tagetes erecta]
MNPQAKLEESILSPSFNCYSSQTSTSKSITKALQEQHTSQFNEIDVENDEEDFEFSVLLADENDASNEFDVQNWTVFPVFNRDLVNNNVDHEINSVTSKLHTLFVDDPEESCSYSSSEIDELENVPSETYCVWRPKNDGGSSPVIAKCKKSNSTGSGSKRWRFRYLLRRSNSEGKEPMEMVTSKQKRNSSEVSNVVGRWKAKTPVHEQFYVQRRAENEVVKRKSYLPYRKDLVGLFVNVNGIGKMLPF